MAMIAMAMAPQASKRKRADPIASEERVSSGT